MRLKFSFFKQTRFVSVLLLIFGAISAQAHFTYEGTLVDPNGVAVNGAVVFKLEIISAGAEACVLYAENQNINMTNPDGYFSINVGTGTGSNPYPLNKVMQNQVTFSGLTCASGTTFQGAPGDGRRMRVTITVGANAPEVLGMINLNSVPMADTARAVGAFEAHHLLRGDDGSGNPVNVPAFNPAQITELINLIAGTSPRYAQNSPGGGAQMPSYSGSPAGPMPGTTWFDNSSNTLKYWNGTTAVPLTAPAAGFGYPDLMNIPINQFKVGSDQLTVVAGKVGVGTSSPAFPFEVFTSLTGNVANFSSSYSGTSLIGFTNTSDTAVRIGSQANSFVVRTGTGGAAPERLRIDEMGNVGIGTTVPSVPFELQSSTSEIARFRSTTGNTVIGLGSNASIPVRIGAQGSDLVFYMGTTPTEQMRLSATGALGIGIANPASRLAVAGAVQVGPDGSCMAAKIGAIAWNSGQLQVCDGSMWRAIPVAGPSAEFVTTGLTADFQNAPNVILTSASGSGINLINMIPGGHYELIIEDTTSRMYTFSGSCTTTYYSPANAATTAGTRTIYKIRFTGASKCYVEWRSFQ